MAGNLSEEHNSFDYEYLSQWPCSCRLVAVGVLDSKTPEEGGPCGQCDGKGYFEAWLPFDTILTFGPVLIVGYRIAGMPSSSEIYSESSVRDALMDAASYF